MSAAAQRAWATEWGGIVSIVLASTPGRAKSATFRAAKEVGYGVKWTDIRCKRVRQYDVLLLSTTRRMTPLAPEVADQIRAQYR